MRTDSDHVGESWSCQDVDQLQAELFHASPGRASRATSRHHLHSSLDISLPTSAIVNWECVFLNARAADLPHRLCASDESEHGQKAQPELGRQPISLSASGRASHALCPSAAWNAAIPKPNDAGALTAYDATWQRSSSRGSHASRGESSNVGRHCSALILKSCSGRVFGTPYYGARGLLSLTVSVPSCLDATRAPGSK